MHRGQPCQYLRRNHLRQKALHTNTNNPEEGNTFDILERTRIFQKGWRVVNRVGEVGMGQRGRQVSWIETAPTSIYVTSIFLQEFNLYFESLRCTVEEMYCQVMWHFSPFPQICTYILGDLMKTVKKKKKKNEYWGTSSTYHYIELFW